MLALLAGMVVSGTARRGSSNPVAGRAVPPSRGAGDNSPRNRSTDRRARTGEPSRRFRRSALRRASTASRPPASCVKCVLRRFVIDGTHADVALGREACELLLPGRVGEVGAITWSSRSGRKPRTHSAASSALSRPTADGGNRWRWTLCGLYTSGSTSVTRVTVGSRASRSRTTIPPLPAPTWKTWAIGHEE